MVRALALGALLCTLGCVNAACPGPLRPFCALIDAIKRFMALMTPKNLRLGQVSFDTPVSSVQAMFLNWSSMPSLYLLVLCGIC